MCNRWDVQNYGDVTDTDFVEGNMSTAVNFCRNPGGRADRPWCYIDEMVKTWEYCDVSRCEKGKNPHSVKANPFSAMSKRCDI